MNRASWRRYPYALSTTDAQLTFPAAEGDQGAESNTYYVAGRLRGRTTGGDWAFLTIFTFNDVRKRVRADFHTIALFDLTSGEYGTFSESDLPSPLRIRRRYKLSVAAGWLDVAFVSAHGTSRWTTRRNERGALVPFSYELELIGRDRQGRRMALTLEVETHKPPLPVGGSEFAGVKTCMGQYGTHSYFQSDVRFRGRLEWGDVRDEVDGDSGWIDRQWTPRYLGVHSDRRNSGYRHEWRQIHLDNGVEMSVWLHLDRHRTNRPIPFCGATAALADGSPAATTEFTIERLSFVRDPGHVPPRYPLTRGPKYFADRYRLRVPAWELEVESEPLVAAPAHALPIEYWSGPTRVRGRMAGEAVTGFGFHERTLALARDFELVDVLRSTLRHLPEGAFSAGSPGPLGLANLVWEVDAFLSHGGRRAAREHLHRRVRPWLQQLADPHRAHALQIVQDLESLL
jgi:predicted secreted hydrolase